MFSKIAAPKQTELPTLKHFPSETEHLTADSRQIRTGDTFVACQGEYADGRTYIQAAINHGAAFVYWDADGDFAWQPEWQVPNQPIAKLRQRAGMLAATAYGNTENPLDVIGVTGTNGKTSITQWLAQAIDSLEKKTFVPLSAQLATATGAHCKKPRTPRQTPFPYKPCCANIAKTVQNTSQWKYLATDCTNIA